jgi:hypothetical protein
LKMWLCHPVKLTSMDDIPYGENLHVPRTRLLSSD